MILVDQTSLNGTFSVHLDFKTVAPFFHLPFKQAFSLWRVFKFFLNMNEMLYTIQPILANPKVVKCPYFLHHRPIRCLISRTRARLLSSWLCLCTPKAWLISVLFCSCNVSMRSSTEFITMYLVIITSFV